MSLARRVACLVTAACTVVSLTACSKGDEQPVFTLDQSARNPDAAGVVVSADSEAIVFAGGQRFPVDPGLVAFSVQDVDSEKLLPVAGFKGAFAQVGLADGKVIWVGSFGFPLPDDDGVETIYFTARVRKLDGKRLEFQRGIVVPLADGVTTEASAGEFVRAKIDPTTGTVRALERP